MHAPLLLLCLGGEGLLLSRRRAAAGGDPLLLLLPLLPRPLSLADPADSFLSSSSSMLFHQSPRLLSPDPRLFPRDPLLSRLKSKIGVVSHFDGVTHLIGWYLFRSVSGEPTSRLSFLRVSHTPPLRLSADPLLRLVLPSLAESRLPWRLWFNQEQIDN